VGGHDLVPATLRFLRAPLEGMTSDDTSLSKGVTAHCPLDKELIGAGAETSGGLGEVVIDDITPDSTLTNVRVAAHNAQAGPIGDWFLRAYAICANA
jgi:hypothetical protein